MANDILNCWERVTIAGKQADVFSPETLEPFRGAVIFLHGHGLKTLAEDEVFTQELNRHQLPVVCPHGGQSWWLDRVCSDFDESISPMDYLRRHVVSWIGEEWKIEPPLIGLLGISMGGQGALQLAYRHAREFPIVAAISPAIDFQQLVGQGYPLDEMFSDTETARQQTVTLHLHPLNWPRHQLIVSDPADASWHEGAERLVSKLASTGIMFEDDLETSAGGHSWDYFRHMAPRCIGFIADRLDKERRREA
ncbi:MAG: hypothetical protein KDA93_19895 [Planctomycetaceae bacterium]|nr:hypothetical protein [Planctomycetaceae bacterium]